MKFLLQEKRLSEEHLDAIWAAIEKPDQFETVENLYIEIMYKEKDYKLTVVAA